MSYMTGPRLHFVGKFQADVSTINNMRDNFNVHSPNQPPPQGPGWNPGGTGNWKLSNCVVTSAVLTDGRQVTASAGDPVVGSQIASVSRFAAKLVDLDTEQQMVSQIWGMTVALGTAGTPLFKGLFEAAAFTDIWIRPVKVPRGDGRFSAAYQSVLSGVTWGDVSHSPLLQALQAASAEGLLSISFTVDGYDDDNSSANFRYGRIVGTIGAAVASEPQHFIMGRHCQPAVRTVNYFTAVVDQARGKLVVDFANAFQTDVAGGDLVVPHDLKLVAKKADGSFLDLGAVAPTGQWYTQFAGIWEAPPNRALTAQELSDLASSPLVLVQGAPVPRQP